MFDGGCWRCHPNGLSGNVWKNKSMDHTDRRSLAEEFFSNGTNFVLQGLNWC
ncbi:hypothetical protein HanXRQr2_Chr06g0247681 [Helianthus annuus]|uniref:Uncharacterized protein n=1 Tax=Helianthus annuus TaxID=4232 RepID=A0A251UGB8_HELAN|nr:hypothetical protein HanXRQr2_Chr06g0247681 [Helianthus annuus]